MHFYHLLQFLHLHLFQVHEAEYVVPATGKSTKVAVKVLHPGVLELVEADMDLLKWFVSSLEVIPRVKYLSLGPLVDEFRALLTEQLDMNTEVTLDQG